ncbi:hypothetical protein H8E50_11740 [bacterium]|nr:hypothetical protein [bacterium]
MAKLNCWEMKDCGREEGGLNAARKGVCPVYTRKDCNGINGGINAGRICWTVAGTFCEGEVQGDFAIKYASCTICDVLKRIKKEEGSDFLMLPKN